MAESPVYSIGGNKSVDEHGNRYDSDTERAFGRYLDSISAEWIHHPRPPSGRYYFRGADGTRYEPDYLVKTRTSTPVWIVFEVKWDMPASFIIEHPKAISVFLRKMESVRAELPWVALALVPWEAGMSGPDVWLLNLRDRWRFMEGTRQVGWWKMPERV